MLIEDKSIRALSILKTARILGYQEALVLLAAVKMGVETDVIIGSLPNLLKLFILIQPGHIDSTGSGSEKKMFTDGLRAELVKTRIQEFEPRT